MNRGIDRNPQAQAVMAALMVGCAVSYALLISQFFPSPTGTLGHDYAYFLPQLLAGELWWRANGWTALPWFSPHACGGLPLLANPQSVSLSIPQLLFHFLSPARMAEVTLLASAGTGTVASWHLLRRRFSTSPEAATLAALLFLFNGFLMYRMVIGHLTYHVFGLVPLAALICLPPVSETKACIRSVVARASAFGLIVGYFVYAGALNYLGPLCLILAILGALFALRNGPRPSFFPVLAGGMAIGAAIGAMKLAPAWVFIQAFPRVIQKMTLVDNLPALLGRILASLFLPNLLDLVREPPYEFEYGVSLAALVLVVAAGRRRLPMIYAAAAETGRRRYLAALGALLALPIALSYGSDGWGHLLKMLPYLKNTVVPFRWWSVYIPVAVAGAALSFDALFPGPSRPAWLAVMAVCIVAQAWARDGRIYRGEDASDYASMIERPFDPGPIARARAAGHVIPINRLDAHGTSPGDGWRNDLMVEGISPLPCYEPIFGYGQETFPATSLHSGDALAADADGRLNLANPACYLYGPANGCAAGQAFSISQAGSARAFLAYRPFTFVMPWWQSLATYITCVTIPLALLGAATWPRRSVPTM